MKIKNGIDIIEVSRIKENIEEMGERFLERVYTDKEIEYCENKNVQKYQSYAARFAGKEAAFKALSSLIDNKYDVSWKDIEIINDEEGRPFVNILGNLKEIVGDKVNIEISLSHIQRIAAAEVMVYY
ncbi:MAG: holo-ACP synthase [Clostridia bacterium]|nr:holo-ACP synthase [Clostridia bacterium]MBR4261588.1 holo-ACP synthase [Clostridia bacterium]